MKRIHTFMLSAFIAVPAFGQEAAPSDTVPDSGPALTNTTIMILILLAFMILMLFVARALLKAAQAIEHAALNPQKPASAEPARMLEYAEWVALKKAKKAPPIWNKVLGLKPIEEESSLLLEENYDGITELNNPTPAWFMGLFYATIVFAVVYLLSYHVFDLGKLQEEEYRTEMAKAKSDHETFLANAANAVDETTVTESHEADVIATGQNLFAANCAPCHGDKGQGVVGPNLTDDYWIHGGKINDIFKTIKYGVADKGMISWESKLTPKQIASVANFILSLKGTNPAGAKAPQGDKEG
jgi:cytochrome c oxidase cbb3-type subunit 3